MSREFSRINLEKSRKNLPHNSSMNPTVTGQVILLSQLLEELQEFYLHKNGVELNFQSMVIPNFAH